MLERFEGLLVRVLRVPPAPQPPAGTPESIQVFRASRDYFRLRLGKWSLKQVATLIGIIAYLSFIPSAEKLAATVVPKVIAVYGAQAILLLRGIEIIGIVGFIVQVPLTLAMVRLDYRHRYYIVTDRSFRIREGIRQVREMTMTYANVQEISIRQGPLQRLLGFADLQVRSAGGGAGHTEENDDEEQRSMHIAYFRGVANAEQLRDLIQSHLRRLRDAGLGDPDDPSTSAAPSTEGEPGSSLTDAAQLLLSEARQLRQSLLARPGGTGA